MTLQRRLLLLLLLAAPLVWVAGLLFGLNHARLEIDELFDTQQIRLARQLLAILPAAAKDGPPNGALNDPTQGHLPGPVPPAASGPGPAEAFGSGDLEELSIAVWDRFGVLRLADNEGELLPVRDGAEGFVDLELRREKWRVYYFGAGPDRWRVAVGQKQEERDELVWSLVAAQLVPWVLTLPFLLLAMALAVRQALKPVRALTQQIERREATDLRPLSARDLPTDLQPLLQAMNTLLTRIASGQERERRFIADAAHELRTPLAALQAQWDAWTLGRAATGAGDAADAAPKAIADGLARMARLTAQLLALSRLEQAGPMAAPATIDWPVLVQGLFGELLPLADRRQVELECVWPPQGAEPLRLHGDDDLITALLRNLLDNALRHSAPGQTVRLQLLPGAIEVHDDGPGVAEADLPRLGERFFRADGQETPGSGLGLSIVQRIAELHGLRLQLRNRPAGPETPSGFVARLEFGDRGAV